MTTSDKKKNRRSKKERYDKGKKILSRQTDRVSYRADVFSDHKKRKWKGERYYKEKNHDTLFT